MRGNCPGGSCPWGKCPDTGLTKDLSHILIIFMEISSWPWALFTFKFIVILMTKLSEKGTEFILEFVNYIWFSSSLLPLARGVHSLIKKSLKIFVLALKSVTNLLLTKRDGITGILLPLEKPFKKDQYIFNWSVRSLSFVVRCFGLKYQII